MQVEDFWPLKSELLKYVNAVFLDSCDKNFLAAEKKVEEDEEEETDLELKKKEEEKVKPID